MRVRKVSERPSLLFGFANSKLIDSTGWNCCKPRVLTFDEFLKIPPCTTGKHTTIAELPLRETNPEHAEPPTLPPAQPDASDALDNVQAQPVAHVPQDPSPPTPQPGPSESEDDPSLPLLPNLTCRRRGCEATSSNAHPSRDGEECTHHPGHALFHEGSKGWTCCRKRVLEFDEFMKIQGCKTKSRHLFVGKKRDGSKEEAVGDVRCVSHPHGGQTWLTLMNRHDFYQTPTTVIASFFLKKIDKSKAKVDFSSPDMVELDLPTADNKRYKTQIPLFGKVNAAESEFKVLGTKLELVLVKTDRISWRTLRRDEQAPSGIFQVGPAQRA